MLKSLWRTGMKNTSDTDKSKFDELKDSGKIENYKIIHDVHFSFFLIINLTIIGN